VNVNKDETLRSKQNFAFDQHEHLQADISLYFVLFIGDTRAHEKKNFLKSITRQPPRAAGIHSAKHIKKRSVFHVHEVPEACCGGRINNAVSIRP
jgi:hypothetical protein